MTVAYAIALAMDWDNLYWAGFACVIICMDAGPNALNAFNIAMLRAQGNGSMHVIKTFGYEDCKRGISLPRIPTVARLTSKRRNSRPPTTGI